MNKKDETFPFLGNPGFSADGSAASTPGSLVESRRHLYLKWVRQKVKKAPAVPGLKPGKKAVLVFFETDCPTCQLALPYLNALSADSAQVIGLSQDDEASTR